MSNRGPHAQDSFVIERRLRPIYDWLDAGSYKKAIQECDKVLKKSSNLHRVKGLKALALVRMGKEAECMQILNALAATKPTEEATLQAMTMCYRELQQLEPICKLYEEAVKEDPLNEELHSHLFMAYVRMSNYKCQQQAAMTLYKLQPKKPYYCWAIMSIILQAERGEGASDEKKHKLLLSLAERMIDKLIQENKMEAEPVQLYIIILEALKKYDKIVEVLDGPLGAKLTGEMVHNKLPYLIKLEKWSAVNVMCKNILQQNMDRWDIWKHYLQSIFAKSNASNGNKENLTEDPDDTPQKAHEFICELVENGAGFSLRGPYLARFELAKYLQSNQHLLTTMLGDVSDLFVEYFRKFGHKPCVVSDLRNYLGLLSPEKRLELAGKLVKEVGISATSVPQVEEQMQRHICALQLSRLCGSHKQLQFEHAMALVTAFAFHYQHGYQSFGKDMLPTEQGPSDAYVLLAAHLLFDLFAKSDSSRPLLLALMLLKKALGNSPSNFHIKLLILRIYHVLGSYTEAQGIYESLDIKHLQLDSMCHIHCAHLAATGHYTNAAQEFDMILKFFSVNYRDSSEHLTFSYKFGSFLKLTEFMDFRERMNNSFHYTSVAVDRMFLSLEQCATTDAVFQLDTIPRDHPVAWDLIRNNSDLSVYVSWDPERTETMLEDWIENQSIYEQDVHLLKLRVAVLYCVNSALQLVKCENKQSSEKIRLQLEQEIENAENLQSEIERKGFKPVKQKSLSITQPSRLEIYQKTLYHNIVLNGFKLIVSLEKDETAACQAAIDTTATAFDVSSTQIVEMLQNSGTNGKSDPFLHNRSDIQTLCNFVEITSVIALTLLVSLELTRISPHGKKKKQDTKWRDAVLGLVTSARDAVRRVDAALEEHPTASLSAMQPTLTANVCEPANERALKEITEKLTTLNITPSDEEAIVAAIAKSNETAVREIRGVLKYKIKLLNVNS